MIRKKNKNAVLDGFLIEMAGVEGIEPPIAVLETVVIPFNYTPSKESSPNNKIS